MSGMETPLSLGPEDWSGLDHSLRSCAIVIQSSGRTHDPAGITASPGGVENGRAGAILKADRDRSSSLMSRALRLCSPPGRAPFLPLSQDFFATPQFSDVLATIMLQF
ncbi:hypothetical protein PpBr36_00789 [Pyricularia pennisetigena]|uniref:hypothetical protein n=1 Tax=Pyricularia pennisetigena TaxID=1578925 RepID=UPI00114EACD7|nr:hypothetical protein PpBr36_00789 [Pyricularia pennisetigena]TLS28325.1 hypothetical protein PpBr36_00789 [Pyricularia pennisetigena]